jgi:hypothetical protein
MRRLTAIADQMPDAAARDEFMVIAAKECGFAYSDDRQGLMLAEISTPEARLDALKVMKISGRLSGSQSISDGQLQKWGISRPQLEEAFAAPRGAKAVKPD